MPKAETCPVCAEPRANFDVASYPYAAGGPAFVEGCQWCGSSFLRETLDDGPPHGRSPNAPEFLLPPGERGPVDAEGYFLLGATRGPDAPTECGRRGMNHRMKIDIPEIGPTCQNPDCEARLPQ